jgi:hypothetical protein
MDDEEMDVELERLKMDEFCKETESFIKNCKINDKMREEPKIALPLVNLCNGDWQDFSNKLLKLPDEIAANEKKIFAFGRKLDTIAASMKQLESLVYLEVAAEKDESSKAKFSNESTRDAETKRRLSGNPDFAVFLNQQDLATSGLHDEKVENVRLVRSFRVAEMIVDLARLRLRC